MTTNLRDLFIFVRTVSGLSGNGPSAGARSETQENSAGDAAGVCAKELMEGVDIQDARADVDGKILNGRWVLCNKSDLETPDCRARYVACELNLQDDVSYPSLACFHSPCFVACSSCSCSRSLSLLPDFVGFHEGYVVANA